MNRLRSAMSLQTEINKALIKANVWFNDMQKKYLQYLIDHNYYYNFVRQL